MKILEFIYQETQIHFALQNDGDVMINATEMAKAFNKRTSHYLANEKTKELIKELELTEKSANSDVKILENRGHLGYYFHELLALDFAAWLDIKFRVWIYKTIRDITMGNYKTHWDAHKKQIEAEKEMKALKQKLLTNPTAEIAIQYFEAENTVKACKSTKLKAIKEQYKIDFN
ncbi:KilA-N domain-containing protein [Winogradskyella sp.]|uniref:KilA-N domain-containing protein n=1 Tax=Winogradskyella sp. TaxID=1883156 RepID=UPI003BAA5808